MFNIIKKEDGFTLIELLVVIAVLGILAGIAVPRFVGVREKAVVSEGENALGTISNSMEMYYMEEGDYPDKLDDLGDYIDNVDEILGEWEIENDKDGNEITVSDDGGSYAMEITHGKVNDSLKLDDGEINK